MKKLSLLIFLTAISPISALANPATCTQGSEKFCVFIQTTTVPISLNLRYESLNGSGKYVIPPPNPVGPGSISQFVVQIVDSYNTMGNVRYGFRDDKGIIHSCSISYNCSHGATRACQIMSAKASGSDNTFLCDASYTAPSGQNSGTFTLQITNTSKDGSSR